MPKRKKLLILLGIASALTTCHVGLALVSKEIFHLHPRGLPENPTAVDYITMGVTVFALYLIFSEYLRRRWVANGMVIKSWKYVVEKWNEVQEKNRKP